MTQRIFDIENEKDMVDLWNILPENIYKLVKDEYQASLLDKNGEWIFTVPYRLIKINWHDKTEITRPIQEASEADIGKWCCFWDNCSEDVTIGKLSVIVQDRGKPSYRLGGYAVFDHARRLTKQDIEELLK